MVNNDNRLTLLTLGLCDQGECKVGSDTGIVVCLFFLSGKERQGDQMCFDQL